MKDYTDIVNKARQNKLNKKKDEEEKVSSSSFYDATPIVEKRQLEKRIGLDTFADDYNAMNSVISNAYSGWNSQNYMKANKNNVLKMAGRLDLIKQYKDKYAPDMAFDVDGALDYYKEAINNWKNQMDTYAQYKTAESYAKAKTKFQLDDKYTKKSEDGSRKGLSYDEVKAELGKQKSGSDEHNYLSNYTNYTNLEDFDKAIEEVKARVDATKPKKYVSQVSPSVSPQPTAKKEVKEKSADEKYLEELERARNLYKLENGVNDYYAKYRNEEDFAEKSKYKSTVRDKATWGGLWVDSENEAYEYINDVNGSREKVFEAYKGVYGSSHRATTPYEDKYYDLLETDEKEMYNYLFSVDKDLANQYLEEMEVTLAKRQNDIDTGKWKEESNGVGGGIMSSIASIPASVYGGASSLLGNTIDKLKGKEYNPYASYNMASNYASTVRENVGQNIAENTDWEWLGTNMPSFLYQTSMSIGDTILGGKNLGKAYSVVAGSNAFQQKAKELKEAGENDDVVFGNAFASGLAEMGFEYISLDKLIKIDGVDSLKKGFIASLKQAGIEGSEEFFTEVSNIAFDEWYRGDNSQLSQLKKNLIEQGYTEEEALKQARNQMIRQVGEALAGGIISGGVMGGGSSIGNAISNRRTGAEIRENERMQELFDIMTPEEKEAYQLYTEYSNKGVTKDNIKDVQLGNLYNTAYKGAVDTMESSKSTEEQKVSASNTLKALAHTQTKKSEAEIQREEAKAQAKAKASEYNIGEVNEITDSGDSFEIQGRKVEDGEVVLVTNEGDIALSEATLSENDGMLLAYAENMDESKGNLFVSSYDSSVDVDTYFDDFTNVYEKSVNGFSQDVVLRNKGSLSEVQVGEIYANALINVNKQKKQLIDSINEKSSKNFITEGTFNDSVIDYNNATTDGSKVNWKDLNDRQRQAVRFVEGVSKALGINVVLEKEGKQKGYNGWYDPNDNYIHLDVHAGIDNALDTDTIIPTFSHEMTHWMKQKTPEMYQKLMDYATETIDIATHGSIEAYVERERARLDEKHPKKDGSKHTSAEAMDEILARTCEDMLTNSETVREFMGKLTESEQKTFIEKVQKLFKDILDWVNEMLDAYKGEARSEEAQVLRKYQERFEEMSRLWDEALADAVQTNQGMLEQGTTAERVLGEVDIDGNPSSHKYSVRSMVEGAGLFFEYNEDDGQYRVLENKNGKEVTSVSVSEVKNSPLGNIVNVAVQNKFISEAEAEKQYTFLTELVNLCLDYKDNFTMVWEIAGTQVFSAIKSNSDTQYGKTIDFSTVCKKTQQVINVISEAQRKLKRGLTRDEIKNLVYDEVGKAGEPTPCPVCYVFSRWMGIGGILQQMYDYQNKYKNMSEADMQKFLEEVEQEVYDYAFAPKGKLGKPKATFFDKNGVVKKGTVIADMKQKANGKINSANKAIQKYIDTVLKIQELETIMEHASVKDKEAIQKKISKMKSKLKDTSVLENNRRNAEETLKRFEEYQWLTKTYMDEVLDDKGKHLGWKKDENFKPVDDDTLFDLRRGSDFATKYPKSWKYRTTKGCNAGKAILPYSDARVGEIIQGVSYSNVKDILIGEKNPFLNGNIEEQTKYIKNAIRKQLVQNLLGGMRYQSTSDFRYEYGSDYLMTFLELQAIGGKVQLYTKVIEAVDFLASVGADVNLSVMPLNDGYVIHKDGRKQLLFSQVTGINAEAAIQKSREYDNVQLILVGISDEHIRLAMQGDDVNGDIVSFIIPFHGSGNTTKTIQQLMDLLGEELDVTKAQDYSLVQTDHFAKNRTPEQKAMWELRKKIISRTTSVNGKSVEWDGSLTASEHNLLKNNSYLDNLYNRFYVDESAQEYGLALSSAQAEQIFPYEYWDKSLTYAEADQNGERFKEYCKSMGIVPRFSGVDSKGKKLGFGNFVNDKGYWKLLIDRKMYNNDGTYHEQKQINLTNFSVDTINPSWGSATYGDVMQKDTDPKKTNAIVENVIRQLGETQYSDRNLAPTFYSHMGKVVDGIKQDKIGANSVVNYLKGKGVKDEEIKWSGIETFLEGKKSVTKAELQEFVAGSMLQIEEETLSDIIPEGCDELKEFWVRYIDNSISDSEFVESIKNSDAQTLKNYVYEIYEEGYIDESDVDELDAMIDKVYEGGTDFTAETKWHQYRLDGGSNYRELLFKMPNSDYFNPSMKAHWGQKGILAHARIQDIQTDDGKKMLFIEEIQSDWHNAGQKNGYLGKGVENMPMYNKRMEEFVKKSVDDKFGKGVYEYVFEMPFSFMSEEIREVEKFGKRMEEKFKAENPKPSPNTKKMAEDAPFRNNYHEYVLKRLLRMASEEGYDAIGWTPADIQAERWSDEYMEGYRIEYDQDIPKFLRKYGKKWGATVGQDTTTSGYDVWSMDITDAMKESVLYEGQVMYSDRDSDGNQLTPEQAEFFKDSKVRDENGNLLVLYHGTESYGFTVFETINDSEYGAHFGSKASASEFSDDMYKVYLNIKNPINLPDIFGTCTKLADYVFLLHGQKERMQDPLTNGMTRKPITPINKKSELPMNDAFEDYANNAEYWAWYDGSEEGAIEVSEKAQAYLKSIGYDGVEYVNEFEDKGSKSYMVFDSNQIKNVDNTNPTEDEDIRYSDRKTLDEWLLDLSIEDFLEDYDFFYSEEEKPKKQRAKRRVDEVNKRLKEIGLSFNGTKIASWTDERIDKYLDGGYYGSSDPKYAQAYITYMTPQQFLGLTLGDKNYTLDTILKESESYGELDINKIGDSSPIRLYIDEGKKSAKVVGHEGRHRMYLLGKAGFEKIPVLMFDYGTKYSKKYKTDLELIPQRYANTDFISSTRNVVAWNVIPFSQGFRDVIINDFGSGNKDADISYSDRDIRPYGILEEEYKLAEENKALKEDIRSLKYMLQIEREKKFISRLDESRLKSASSHLLKQVDSTFDKTEFADEMREIYLYIGESENVDGKAILSKCSDLARRVMAKSNAFQSKNKYFDRLLSDIQKASASIDGDMTSAWNELAKKYPKVFPSDVNPSDMATELQAISNSVKETANMYKGFNKELARRSLATEIYNQYWYVSNTDKKDKEIQKLRLDHRKTMDFLREKNNERYQKQRLADEIHYGKIINKVKKENKEKIKHIRELDERRTKTQRLKTDITRKAMTLNRWLKVNSKKEHINEDLKPIVRNFLLTLDFSSKTNIDTGGEIQTQADLKFAKALSHLYRMAEESTKAIAGEGKYYGVQFAEGDIKNIGMLAELVNDRISKGQRFVLNQLSMEELQVLDDIVTKLKKGVEMVNEFHTIENQKGVANLARNMAQDADRLGQISMHTGKIGALEKMLNYKNKVPHYMFKMFGENGMKVFKAFQDGWDKFAFNTKKIIEFTRSLYTSKEVRAWKKEVHTINHRGKQIKITATQLMSLYCLRKREQALKHITQGGIHIADFEEGRNVIAQNFTVHFTERELDAMLRQELSNRQIQVAEKLQEFMNTVCTEWGNEVTMKLYGINQFGLEKFYFPIKSDPENINTNEEQVANENPLFRLLNMSFSKPLNEDASNRIMVLDIFDVFAGHTSDMAKYNALALPVLDTYKLLNYKERIELDNGEHDDVSLKRSMNTAYGKDAVNYIYEFLKDLNGASNTSRDTIAKTWHTKAKIVAVAANLKVALLQPTSYVRARMVVKDKYLMRALLHNPVTIKKNYARALKYCGMVAWKAMGFYDTNISRGVLSQITHDETFRDKLVQKSMKGAEVGDQITLGYLWTACEHEIRNERKDLKVNTEEFYNAIALRLREVIYSSQVVDSTMTRSSLMRSGDGYDKIITSFMSEPTLSLNMLHDAYTQYKLTERAEGKKVANKKHRKNVLRTINTYALTSALASLVSTAMGMYRDNDDEEEKDLEELWEMYKANLKRELSLIGKVPYLSDLLSSLDGYSSSRMDTQWMDYFAYTVNGVKKLAEGEGSLYTTAKNAIRLVTYVSGLPFYNLYRDVLAGADKAGILEEEDLKEIIDDIMN